MHNSGSPSRGEKRTWLLIVLPLMALMAASFYFYTHVEPRLTAANFYGRLGDAFMAGQTYLKMTPSPELLAQPDPYEPDATRKYGLWDAALYNGKYYLYFGPVPAALFWVPVKFLTGHAMTDPEIVLLFTTLGTACLIWLFAAVALHERLTSRFGLACVLLTLIFGTWLPFMLRRPSFYEAAISGAYCFSALGFLLLWYALLPTARRVPLLLASASFCFGLAAGCRMIHACNLLILLLALFTLWRRRQGSLPRFALLLLAPWSLCMAALMAYNYARFGSLLETGANYNLTVFNVHKPDFKVLRPDRIVPGLYYYLFRPLPWRTDHTFPFFHITYYDKITLPFFHIPVESFEPAYGLLVNSPLSLMFLAVPYCWAQRRPLAPESRTLLTGVALLGLLLFGFLLLYFYTTSRYCVDFAPWLMFFAGFQYLRLLSLVPSQRIRYVILVLGALATFYGVFAGAISGYCGEYLCDPSATP